jgi:hypothetical protein
VSSKFAEGRNAAMSSLFAVAAKFIRSVGPVLILAAASGVTVAHADTENVVYSFSGRSDGNGPEAGLINIDGALYGTNSAGGRTVCSFVCGTIFALTPPSKLGGVWTETVLHHFQGR